MALDSGTRLGVYEILGPLGAGGMGEVYRARDTRLGREVAIKILPDTLSGDPDRIARFEREARLLASVNHPGIAAIYGAEESDSLRYLVLELVPGETLTEKLATGPLSVTEALEICGQIAEALEAAHEKGIVHRDLKPSNVKVTPEGKVKVLDLGLAKAMDIKSSAENTSQSPTAVLDQTRPGVILGTAEFMSPEQARGKPVDKRADIWAFGCILYETLSGKRAFQGDTVSDVLVSILTSEPDWGALPEETPPRIRELLSRCLQKDPNRRLRDIGDARIEIDQALAGDAQRPALSSATSNVSGRRWLLLVLPLIGLGVAAAWLAFRPRALKAPADTERISLVVLPFKDRTGEPNGQLIGDGFAETISVRFAKVPGVQVVPPTATTSAAESESDPFRVAEKVGAVLAVDGSLQRVGDQMRVTFFVLNVRQRGQIAGGEVTGPASQLFDLQDQVFEKVARDLELQKPAGRSPPSGLASAADQDQYLRALGLLQRYERQSSVDWAIGILQSLARTSSESALVHAALGRAYLYKFRLTRDQEWSNRAIASCDRAIGIDPNSIDVQITLGEIRTETGGFAEAIGEFQRALAKQPENAQAVRGLAQAYELSGDLKHAEDMYKRAINLQPAYWAGYNKLGVFYLAHGQNSRSAEMFLRVTQLTPDNPRGYSSLGAAYQMLDRFEEARMAYLKSIQLKPTSAAHTNLGTLEYYLGNYDAAARAFERAVELTPKSFRHWANLGDAYRWSSEARSRAPEAYDKAIALGLEELKLNPRNSGVHRALAGCYAKQGDPELAADYIRTALEIDPTDTNNLFQAAVVASLAGRKKEALGFLERAVRAGSGTAHIEREPEFRDLRREKEFQQLIARSGSSSP